MLARLTLLALLCAIGSSAAANSTSDTSSRFRERATAQLAERFRNADGNGDGRLTREEARGRMPRVFESFATIDAERKGYVTEEELRRFATSTLQERQGARTMAPSASQP